MKRILISVQHLALGGMEKMVCQLALGLRARGHDIVVASLQGSGFYADPLTAGDVPVYTWPTTGRACLLTPFSLRRLCRARRIQIGIAAMGGGMFAPAMTLLACSSLSVPCLRWLHMTPGEPLSTHGLIAQYIMNRVSHVVTLTDAHRRAVARKWHVPPASIHTIWNGQPLPPLHTPEQRMAVRRQLNLPPDAFVVGMVAGFRPVKRHEILLRAFSRVAAAVPHAHLLLVGDGETRPKAEQLIGELQLSRSVTLTGEWPDAWRLYPAMDVHVLCSFPEETFPLVVTEAMAAGVAAVATRVGGLPEIVQDGRTGVLVAPESPSILAEAVIALAEDPSSRARIGQAASAFAHRHFSLEAMLDRFETLIEQWVPSGDRGGGCRHRQEPASA